MNKFLVIFAKFLAIICVALFFASFFYNSFTNSGYDYDRTIPAVQFFDKSYSFGEESNVSFFPVDSLVSDTAIPSREVLSSEIDNIFGLDLNVKTAGIVLDADTGEVLYEKNSSVPFVPASNLKVLTAAAVFASWEATDTFFTKVVSGEKDNEIVLVAGGDVLLSDTIGDPNSIEGRAGIRDLAQEVAEQLLADSVAEVSIKFDTSIFSGPELRSVWSSGDIAQGEISAIDSMAFMTGASSRDIAASKRVVDVFGLELSRFGIRVVAGPVVEQKAVVGAREYGVVESARVFDLARYMMVNSDNYLAEVLGRMVAYKTLNLDTVNSDDGVVAVTRKVESLGLSGASFSLTDTSGLSDQSTVTAYTLASLFRIATFDSRVNPLLYSLPVAGVSGTLATRFQSYVGGADVLGNVRAKTGTLYESGALSGYLVNVDGRMLIFSFMVNDSRAEYIRSVYNNLDSTVAILQNCSCQ